VALALMVTSASGYLFLPQEFDVPVLLLCVTMAVCLAMYWLFHYCRDAKSGGYAETKDIVPLLKFLAFAGVAFYGMFFVLREIFMLRKTAEYIFVDQMGVPLILFEASFLALLTSLILPLFMKVYGSVAFTTYGTMLKKGFDEAITAKEEGRLLDTCATTDRTWYDLFS
jgi:hypothetical protein